jgi:Domain of unknown function (DUF4136)
MRLFALALLGASVSCHATTSSQAPVQPAAHQAAAFSGYHTFSFDLPGQPPAGYNVSERSLEAEGRARQAVAGALVRKGYAKESGKGDKGDFIVRLSSGTRDVSIGDSETGYQPAHSEETNVTIDFFDATSGSHVWHEVAIADADPPTIDVARLQAAVLTAIAAVPAQSPSPVAKN